MDYSKFPIHDAINEALNLYKAGHTEAEILKLFPKHREELKEILRVAGVFASEREKIQAPKTLLRAIINGVTNKEIEGYNTLGTKGRPTETFAQSIKLVMNKARIWLPAGVVVAAIAIFAIANLTPSADALTRAIEDETNQLTALDEEMRAFFEIDASLGEIETSLAELETDDSIGATTAAQSQNALDLAEIEQESQKVDEDSSEIDNFFSNDADLEEVNKSLNDF